MVKKLFSFAGTARASTIKQKQQQFLSVQHELNSANKMMDQL